MNAQRPGILAPRAGELRGGRFRIGDRGFTFAAAHHLDCLPDGHRARRVHGHTWSVEVTLADRTLCGPGFVADFAALRLVGEYLRRELDHQDLSALFAFPTTTGRLAWHIREWFMAHMAPELGRQLAAVHVRTAPAPTCAPAHTERFVFDAAHHLDGLPVGHRCARMHGHTYAVDVVFDDSSDADGGGRGLDVFSDYVRDELDYRDLSELFTFQVTSELLAGHLYGWLLGNASATVAGALRAVRVWESPCRWAE